jgi:hypothetical protein
MSNCTMPDCESKCIVNIYQDLNDQSVSAPKQLDASGDTINRDTELAWALQCPVLAARIHKEYRTLKEAGKLSGSLSALSGNGAPGLVRFSLIAHSVFHPCSRRGSSCTCSTVKFILDYYCGAVQPTN